MDSFEYLIALVSVIAGLGIARALSGMARLLDARRNILFSWIPICWTASVLLWLVGFWWFTFMLSSFEGWTPGLHVFVLIYAGSIFFLLALLHPESIDEGHDMMERFLDNRKLFFGALLALALIDIADTLIKFRLGLGMSQIGPYVTLIVSWITLSAIAMFVRNRKYHVFFALLFFLAMAFWLPYNMSGILEIVSADSR